MAKKNIKEDTLISMKLKQYEPDTALGEREIVSTSEKGKSYRIKFKTIKPSAVYPIDGVIITEGEKCDKLVLFKSDIDNNIWTEVFVELKGKEVGHAIDQIKATIDKPIFQHKSIGHRWARIVAQSVPSNTGKSVVERARNYFSKKHITFKCKSGVLEEVVE